MLVEFSSFIIYKACWVDYLIRSYVNIERRKPIILPSRMPKTPCVCAQEIAQLCHDPTTSSMSRSAEALQNTFPSSTIHVAVILSAFAPELAVKYIPRPMFSGGPEFTIVTAASGVNPVGGLSKMDQTDRVIPVVHLDGFEGVQISKS